MKKVITLLFVIGVGASSYAQSRTIDRAKEVITKEPRNTTGSYPNDRRVGETEYPNSNSRDAEVNDVNRRYDAKIQAVRANPILSSEEKEKRIRDLEYERAQKIREINNRYYGNNNTYSKNKSQGKNKAYGKSNNGKHLGWEKGKGNPHKTGGYVKQKNKNK